MEASASSYFDLEDPTTAVVLENPMSVLAPLTGLVVVDEAQRAPELFPVLRVLADRNGQPATFLILGSASPELSRQASESLAGRVEIIEMAGFGIAELPVEDLQRLCLRGGFPRSFLARTERDSLDWRENFTRTFLERDLAGLGFGMAPHAMGRFWTMLAHYHGQIWNGNEIASAMGISATTARHYLDALEQTFMIRRLLPWHINVGKRLVKTPRIYFRDSGIFHALQGIATHADLIHHPKLGASWEDSRWSKSCLPIAGRVRIFMRSTTARSWTCFSRVCGKASKSSFKTRRSLAAPCTSPWTISSSMNCSSSIPAAGNTRLPRASVPCRWQKPAESRKGKTLLIPPVKGNHRCPQRLTWLCSL